MKIEKNKDLTRHSQHLDEQYGKSGSKTRDIYEKGFEKLKTNVLQEEFQQQQLKILN